MKRGRSTSQKGAHTSVGMKGTSKSAKKKANPGHEPAFSSRSAPQGMRTQVVPTSRFLDMGYDFHGIPQQGIICTDLIRIPQQAGPNGRDSSRVMIKNINLHGRITRLPGVNTGTADIQHSVHVRAILFVDTQTNGLGPSVETVLATPAASSVQVTLGTGAASTAQTTTNPRGYQFRDLTQGNRYRFLKEKWFIFAPGDKSLNNGGQYQAISQAQKLKMSWRGELPVYYSQGAGGADLTGALATQRDNGIFLLLISSLDPVANTNAGVPPIRCQFTSRVKYNDL